MKKLERGDHVRIKPGGGMSEFYGKTGTIIGTERMGSGSENFYYRVRLDEPVEIPGVGLVEDDLWVARLLQRA